MQQQKSNYSTPCDRKRRKKVESKKLPAVGTAGSFFKKIFN